MGACGICPRAELINGHEAASAEELPPNQETWLYPLHPSLLSPPPAPLNREDRNRSEGWWPTCGPDSVYLGQARSVTCRYGLVIGGFSFKSKVFSKTR